MIAVILAAAPVAATAVTTVAAYRDHARLLIVFAPAPTAALAEQRRDAAAAADAYAARDLRVIEVVGNAVRGASDPAAALRARFGVAPDAFRVVLVGKDGGVKLAASRPIPAAEMAATIDAMPMRQDEMRRR